MTEKKTTYGEAVVLLENTISECYATAGALRDSADLDEKKFFNDLRKYLTAAEDVARSLRYHVYKNGREDMHL